MLFQYGSCFFWIFGIAYSTMNVYCLFNHKYLLWTEVYLNLFYSAANAWRFQSFSTIPRGSSDLAWQTKQYITSASFRLILLFWLIKTSFLKCSLTSITTRGTLYLLSQRKVTRKRWYPTAPCSQNCRRSREMSHSWIKAICYKLSTPPFLEFSKSLLLKRFQ